MKENIKLEFVDIHKTFLNGKIIANNKINLKIHEGEVHAIVGENGSGKSTLMSILFGLYTPDSGIIKIDGEKMNLKHPGAIKKYKIGMVHQHFHLVEKFTVLQNLILGQEDLKLTEDEKEKYNNKIQEKKDQIKAILSKYPSLNKTNQKYLELKSQVQEFDDEISQKYIDNEIDNKKIEIKVLKRKINTFNENSKSFVKNDNKLKELLKELEIFEKEEIEILKDKKLNKQKEIDKILKGNFLKLVEIEKEKENLENDLLTRNITKYGFINKGEALKRYKYITKKYGIKLRPDLYINKLSVGDRQKVEILKTLWDEKDIIILDEPTATLSVKEIESLLELVNKLKEHNVTIIFISHKLKEVKKIADNISVLTKGTLVKTFKNTKSVTIQKIAKEMVGENIKLSYPVREISDEVLFKLENLNYTTSKGFRALTDVSFEIKKGEIFGLAGIEGNGQEEVINIITGIKKYSSVDVMEYKDWDLSKLNTKDKSTFMSHIPIDRFKHGIIPTKDLKFNSIITMFRTEKFSKYFKKKLNAKNNIVNVKNYVMNKSDIEEWTNHLIEFLNVEGASNNNILISNLSGGNQQKFLISRELNKEHELLVAGHPTRGLDIKAIDNIYKKIISNAENKATLLYSLELNELMEVCNRIAIFYKGKIVYTINPKEYTLEQVSKMLVGEK